VAPEAIRYAIFDSDLGRALAAWSAAGLVALGFGDADAVLLDDLQRDFPKARLTATPDTAERAGWVATATALIAAPARKRDDLPLDPRGSDFQRAVWAELRRIPPGKTLSYGEVARRLGHAPRTHARAVGQAVGANPVAVAIPCHRVVGANGGSGGYHWGLARKQALLAREGVSLARADAIGA